MKKHAIFMSLFLLPGVGVAIAQYESATITGVVRDQGKTPVSGALITATNADDNAVQTTLSGADGAYTMANVRPGMYSLMAEKEGFSQVVVSSLQVSAGKAAVADFTLVPGHTATTITNVAPTGFWKRFARAYWDDWHDQTPPGPEPKYRGYEAPESNPPFPFTVWPYGGSPVIGQPNTMLPPLMAALYNGPNGEKWMDSRILIYGWIDAGFNVSSSNKPGFSNAPAAYYVIPNSVQLDQATLYIERDPDTVQTDHFDWGFRLTGLYGEDYRFTTSKGVFSNQLLGENNKYGFDPVMAYVDLYFPQVADGMNIRIGRYVSLPDIEAQLAPNNYTFSHSLTYTYDCYTQEGVNITTRLSNHWMVQTGLSAGCDAAIWTKDAKPTGTLCLSYTWRLGGENLYACANSINDGKYAYNNLAAYYLTWYHKFNKNWHFDIEAWYQYERDVPSIFGTLPIENGANGAWCATGQQSCFAPEWATTSYLERQFGKKDTLSIRTEYFDDVKGQRTGYKTRYSEHLVAWNHWIGSSLVFRPELRFERAYDNPAYDNGTKKNQFIAAADMIWFY